MVGMHQGFRGLRPLLRGGLGQTGRLRHLEQRQAAALSKRCLLGPTQAVELARRTDRTASSSVLRLHGRCLRVEEGPFRVATTTVEGHRRHAFAGLAVADQASAPRPAPRSVGRRLAAKRLARHDRGRPALGRETPAAPRRQSGDGALPFLRTAARRDQPPGVARTRRGPMGDRGRRKRASRKTERSPVVLRGPGPMPRVRNPLPLQAMGRLGTATDRRRLAASRRRRPQPRTGSVD